MAQFATIGLVQLFLIVFL